MSAAIFGSFSFVSMETKKKYCDNTTGWKQETSLERLL
jgi:hypothetical protein